eukprot:49018-Lingulodinium_polyedra.AAC.1
MSPTLSNKSATEMSCGMTAEACVPATHPTAASYAPFTRASQAFKAAKDTSLARLCLQDSASFS